MAIQYAIEAGVLVLRIATVGFVSLRGALGAAANDPAARPRMPLLLDVRDVAKGVRYEDVRWRVQILSQMQEQLGPRWAILTGTGPARASVGRMFAVLSQVAGLDVGMFANKDAAMKWLLERA